MQSDDHWVSARQAFATFTLQHPELGLQAGYWNFHNFLRLHREALVSRDAIRKARGRRWIAHSGRFSPAAFDCATGVLRVDGAYA